MKTEEQIKERLKEIKKDEEKFTEFLSDIYGDPECSLKVETHLWRIRREKEILRWVLDDFIDIFPVYKL